MSGLNSNTTLADSDGPSSPGIQKARGSNPLGSTNFLNTIAPHVASRAHAVARFAAKVAAILLLMSHANKMVARRARRGMPEAS